MPSPILIDLNTEVDRCCSCRTTSNLSECEASGCGRSVCEDCAHTACLDERDARSPEFIFCSSECVRCAARGC